MSVPTYQSLLSSEAAARVKSDETIFQFPELPSDQAFEQAFEAVKQVSPELADSLLRVVKYASAWKVEQKACEATSEAVQSKVAPLELGPLQIKKTRCLHLAHRLVEAAVPRKADVTPLRERAKTETAPPSPSSSSSTPSAAEGSPTPTDQPTTTTVVDPPRPPPVYVGISRHTDGIPRDRDVDYNNSLLDLIEKSAPYMPPLPDVFILVMIVVTGSGIAGVERWEMRNGQVREVRERHKIFFGDVMDIIDAADHIYVPAEDDSACDLNSLLHIFWSSRAQFITLGYDDGEGKGNFDVHAMPAFIKQIMGEEEFVGGHWSSNWRGEVRRLTRAVAEAYNPNHGCHRHDHLGPEGTEWVAGSVGEARERARQICVPEGTGTSSPSTTTASSLRPGSRSALHVWEWEGGGRCAGEDRRRDRHIG